jgi:aspartate carbamoyltransferase catalytic subunit
MKAADEKTDTGVVWRHPHILDVDDFSAAEINLVMDTTDAMKEVLSRPIKKVPTLRGKTVVTLFYEPSTRTRISFEIAAKNLSADFVNMAAATSSISKGESLVDTLRTLESLEADIVVMRHAMAGAPYVAARESRLKIINAGDGWHAHPTQALLDIYTIRQHQPSLNGLKVVIVGDIKHSRVAHSNIWGLTTMGASVTLCAPATLLPAGLENTKNHFPQVNVETNLDIALKDTDIVMALRLQQERQAKGLLPSLREYVQFYQLTPQRLKLAKPQVLLLHPGPVNEDIEIAATLADDPRSLIQEQVTNGIAVRMALFYLLSGSKEL